MGELRNPSDPAIQGLETGQPITDNIKANDGGDDDQHHRTLRIRFNFTPAGVSSSGGHNDNVGLPGWEGVLYRKRLYVVVSSRQFREGSKEAFVSLLEFAEERLACEHVVVCLEKGLASNNNKNNSGDKNNKSVAGQAAVVRNFLFLGFQPLAPGHEFLPPLNTNLVCFVYTI